MKLKKIGFLNEINENSSLKCNIHKYDITKVISYLKDGIKLRDWQEFKVCLFGCGVKGSVLGFSEISDGVWIWPDDLVHYIECHYIDLPDEFIQFLEEKEFCVKIPENLKKELIKERNHYSETLNFIDLEFDSGIWDSWYASRVKLKVEPKIKNHERVEDKIEPINPPDYKIPDYW